MHQQEQYRLAVFGDVLQRAASSAGSRQVYGVFRESERLVQILSDDETASSSLRHIGCVSCGEAGNAFSTTVKIGRCSYSIEFEKDISLPGVVEFYPGPEGLDERRKALVTGGSLAGKRVIVIGAGTLGSASALGLAQAGVGHFKVIDFDRVDTPNLSRHVCDVSDLGRLKAVALADRLRLRGVQADAVVADVTTIDPKLLRLWFRKADLVLTTVDVPSASFFVNELVVETKSTGLFVGAYELAAAGEIIAVRSGSGPCLYCAVGFRAGLTADFNLRERRHAYQGADGAKMVAEPGLGVDVTYLGVVAAAQGLALLDPAGSRGALLGSGFSLVHGPSVPRGGDGALFRAPLEFIQARVKRSEPCPVCGYVTEMEKVP